MTAEQALAMIKDVIELYKAQRLGAGQAMQTISLILDGSLPYDGVAVAVRGGDYRRGVPTQK